MKYMKQLGIVLALVLVVTGCASKVGSTKAEDNMDKGAKTESMADDKMKDDSMKDDKMADDKMKDDDMKSGEHDTMKDTDSMSDDKKMDDDKMSDGKDTMKDNMQDTSKEDTMEMEVKNKGKEAATFNLVDINGKTHNLEDYKGKKVYLKFWASWCSICLSGLGEVDELAGADNDFEVLTIVSPGFSGEKSTEKFTEWFKGLGTKNLNVLFDEGGDIAKAYGVRGYPTSVYIGSDGILVKTLPGHNSNEQITQSFEAIY